jgi:hypothetical protein
MSHPDEGLIHAWLDGELDAEEAARVERLVAEDAAWAAAVAEARGLIAASARILSHLDSVPGDVLPKDSRSGGGVAGGTATPSPRRANQGVTVQPWMRLAAGFVLVVGVGYAARGAFTNPQATPVVASEESAVAVGASVASEAAAASADRAVADVAAPAPVAPGTVGARVDAPAAAPTATSVAASDATPPAGQAFAAKATTPPLVEAAAASGSIAKTSDSIAARERVLAEGRAARAKAAQSAERLDLSNVVVTAAPAAPEARRAEADRASTLAPSRDLSREANREATRAVGGATTSGLSMRSSMAALADASERLTGCWRTTGAAASDSILVNPLVLRSAGDTLVIAISTKPDSAMVRTQNSTAYTGIVIDANGRRVSFSMTRAVCPARP